MLAERWFVCLIWGVLQRLRYLQLDITGKHAADVDDVHFSLAAAAVFAGSYAATPYPTDYYQSSFVLSDGVAIHSFALLSVIWVLAIAPPVLAIVHWFFSLFGMDKTGGKSSTQ